MSRRVVFDHWIFMTAGFLLFAGILMVASASHYLAMSMGGSPSRFLLRHAIWVAAGMIVMLGALRIPYSRLNDRKLVVPVVTLCVVALVAVLAMPPIGGAHRWFPLGFARLQPSEFAKVGIILFMAHTLSRKEEQINEPWSVLVPCVVPVLGMAFLVAIEPDLGTAVMLAATAFVMLFVAGLRLKYVGLIAAVGLAAVLVLVLVEPYRIVRILTYFNPSQDTQGAGFHLAQSRIAVGSGGLTGVGLGQGQQKAFYLPAAHTDFIYSVVGEELGLVGTTLLLAAFLVLFWRGLRTALRAPDRFGFYLALGATSLITIQGLVHMGVCLGILPTKGLTLPMVSYGGSSLVATTLAVGLLLNVSQQSNY